MGRWSDSHRTAGACPRIGCGAAQRRTPPPRYTPPMTRPRPRSTVMAALICVAACSRGRLEPPQGPPPPAGPGSPAGLALDRVAAIHGAAGPFAVAGYRVGERALRELGLARGA